MYVHRELFWTDWSYPAKIEKASMDGSDRRVLHGTGLFWPNDITLDYQRRRVYWADAFMNKIEHSFYNGSDRVVLLGGLVHPFGLALVGELLFWTESSDRSVRVTHSRQSLGVSVLRESLRFRPYGIEAVTPTRQANGMTNNQNKQGFAKLKSTMCMCKIIILRAWRCQPFTFLLFGGRGRKGLVSLA